MNTGLHQSQSMQQTMRMTPQMVQSLEILQIPLMDLQARIQSEMERNPVLEEKIGSGPELVEGEAPSLHAGADTFRTDDDVNDFDTDDFAREFDELGRLASLSEMPRETVSADQMARRQYFMDSFSAPDSLYEHLSNQLQVAGLTEEEKAAGEAILGSLSEDGYLVATTEELAAESGVSTAIVEEVIPIVQEFDPVGVASRDLRECLLVQLKRLDKVYPSSPEAVLVHDHLDEVAQKKWDDIAAKSRLSVPTIQDAAHFISTLEPKPGRQFSAEGTVYITPEIVVYREEEGGAWVIENVRDLWPKLFIRPDYKEMLHAKDTDSEAKKFIREKIKDGSLLMRSIHQRQSTIRRIAVEIVHAQHEFLEHGVSRLKPLTMADVAEKIGLHETTVSRAVSGKYMQTPMGLFELKFFFTPGLKKADGSTISTEAVKNAVAVAIEQEDIKKPLSDQDIAVLLQKQGFHVARRTVAKYREQLGIPPSHLRK